MRLQAVWDGSCAHAWGWDICPQAPDMWMCCTGTQPEVLQPEANAHSGPAGDTQGTHGCPVRSERSSEAAVVPLPCDLSSCRCWPSSI